MESDTLRSFSFSHKKFSHEILPIWAQRPMMAPNDPRKAFIIAMTLSNVKSIGGSCLYAHPASLRDFRMFIISLSLLFKELLWKKLKIYSIMMMIMSGVEDWVSTLSACFSPSSIALRDGDLQEWKRAEKCLLALFSHESMLTRRTVKKVLFSDKCWCWLLIVATFMNILKKCQNKWWIWELRCSIMNY